MLVRAMTSPDYTPDAVRTLARLSRLLERGAGELSLPQFRVLAMVEDGGDRASWLADRLALAKPTITALVEGAHLGVTRFRRGRALVRH